MLSDLYQSLSWLPRAPSNFRELAKALPTLDEAPDAWTMAVRRLADCALDEPQLVRLARAIRTRRDAGRSLGSLVPCRLGLVGNGTLDLLVDPLIATFARYGFSLEVVCTDFDQHLATALDPNSPVNRAQPDAVVIALDWRGLLLRPSLGDAAAAARTVDAALAVIDTLRAGFAEGCGAPCVISTLAPPPETLAGALDRALPGSLRNLCERVNIGIAERVLAGRDRLLDVASIAETVGLANWHDLTLWNTARAPFPTEFAPLWADHVGRLVAAMKGRSRRALVLDLDGTLWGGVVGEDGLEGLLVGQGDPTAEAHIEVQKAALALRSRGVALAAVSKATEGVARAPFTDHPDMLLRLDHLAAFESGVDEIAETLGAVADGLGLGVDALVYLDDDPVERARVREALPEVAVPELPDDPALYARTLAAAGYFELSDPPGAVHGGGNATTDATAAALDRPLADMDAYRRTLDMRMIVSPFEPISRARITQMINKSTHYNLTTPGYEASEVEALENDPAVFTLQARLADVFADNGMISVVVCRSAEADVWEIDTWVMTCRVLGRGVEQMVLREIVAHARRAGVRRLRGRFMPTSHNAMVVDHYARLGFTLIERSDDGASLWSLDVATDVPAPPMTVRRVGFRALADA